MITINNPDPITKLDRNESIATTVMVGIIARLNNIGKTIADPAIAGPFIGEIIDYETRTASRYVLDIDIIKKSIENIESDPISAPSIEIIIKIGDRISEPQHISISCRRNTIERYIEIKQICDEIGIIISIIPWRF